MIVTCSTTVSVTFDVAIVRAREDIFTDMKLIFVTDRNSCTRIIKFAPVISVPVVADPAITLLIVSDTCVTAALVSVRVLSSNKASATAESLFPLLDPLAIWAGLAVEDTRDFIFSCNSEVFAFILTINAVREDLYVVIVVISAAVRLTLAVVMLVDWVTIVSSTRSSVTSLIKDSTIVTKVADAVSVPLDAVPPITTEKYKDNKVSKDFV